MKSNGPGEVLQDLMKFQWVVKEKIRDGRKKKKEIRQKKQLKENQQINQEKSK